MKMYIATVRTAPMYYELIPFLSIGRIGTKINKRDAEEAVYYRYGESMRSMKITQIRKESDYSRTEHQSA